MVQVSIYTTRRDTVQLLLNIEVRTRKNCCCRKAKSVKYSEFEFEDFVMHHANPMRHIVFPAVACLPLPYLLIYFKYRRVFEKNINQRIEYGSFLSYKVFLKHSLL